MDDNILSCIRNNEANLVSRILCERLEKSESSPKGIHGLLAGIIHQIWFIQTVQEEMSDFRHRVILQKSCTGLGVYFLNQVSKLLRDPRTYLDVPLSSEDQGSRALDFAIIIEDYNVIKSLTEIGNGPYLPSSFLCNHPLSLAAAVGNVANLQLTLNWYTSHTDWNIIDRNHSIVSILCPDNPTLELIGKYETAIDSACSAGNRTATSLLINWGSENRLKLSTFHFTLLPDKLYDCQVD